MPEVRAPLGSTMVTAVASMQARTTTVFGSSAEAKLDRRGRDEYRFYALWLTTPPVGEALLDVLESLVAELVPAATLFRSFKLVRAPLYRSVIVCRYASTTFVASSKACCSSGVSVELGEADALATPSADVLGFALGLVAATGSGSLEQPASSMPAARRPARARADGWDMAGPHAAECVDIRREGYVP